MKTNHVMKKILIVVLLVTTLVLTFAGPAFAASETSQLVQDEQPPVDEAPVSAPVIPLNPTDVGILIAVTAFFQKRLGWTGNKLVYLVIAIGTILYSVPYLTKLFPEQQVLILAIAGLPVFILSAMGAVDFIINTGAKIATAEVDSKGKLEVANSPTPGGK